MLQTLRGEGTSRDQIVWVMVVEKGKQAAGEKQGRKPWTLREFGGQTVWDWLHLLSALAIPVVLAIVGLWFTAQQDARQQQIEDNRAQQAQKIENQRAEAERELAEQRAQDETLQAYLSQMSQLMLERKLLEAEPGDPVHTLAQARTSTAILSLDAEHNESVTRFLINSGLAVKSDPSPRLLTEIALENATLSHAHLPNAGLSDADLSDADLSGADLSGADLSGAELPHADLSEAVLGEADLSDALLSGANLSPANLSGADFSRANLSDADLSPANLSDADLSPAILSGADFSRAWLVGTNLSKTSLDEADLSEAVLRGANLEGANLKGANLSHAYVSEEQLAAARSLAGATMPNGQKYEDWVKGRGEENSGSS
jgi:uncharacterized protein YjbI with pentapeptide repeats